MILKSDQTSFSALARRHSSAPILEGSVLVHVDGGTEPAPQECTAHATMCNGEYQCLDSKCHTRAGSQIVPNSGTHLALLDCTTQMELYAMMMLTPIPSLNHIPNNNPSHSPSPSPCHNPSLCHNPSPSPIAHALALSLTLALTPALALALTGTLAPSP